MRSAATLQMHERTWGYIVDHFGIGADARRITRARLQRWIETESTGRLERADGSQRQLSPASIRLRVCTLRAALKIARREGLIGRLPEFPETSFRYKSRTAWLESYADYRRIFDQLPTERRAYFALLVFTWQHPSDVERMTRADLDVFSSEPWVIVRNTKNRRPPLRVAAPAELVEVFREKFQREGGGPGRLEDRLVQPWPSRVRTLPAICERLGLPRITATAARHTGISWAIRHLGITPSVMAWSGHSSPKMIATVYGHAMGPQLDEVAQALDSMRPPSAIPGKEVPPVDVASIDGERKTQSADRESSDQEPHQGDSHRSDGEAVPRDRIELSTQGFSVNPVSVVGSAPSSGSPGLTTFVVRPWKKTTTTRR
jgi:integrase